jgi:hypothetical protein
MLEVNRPVLETVEPRLDGTVGDGREIGYPIVLDNHSKVQIGS